MIVANMSLATSSSCFKLYDEAHALHYLGNFTTENLDILWACCCEIASSTKEIEYSKPMVWIGIYIAVASLFCALAMMADLVHGFRNRKFWFPCKYFTVNATSITLIAIAMKFPGDLNTPTDGLVDQGAKWGSLVFMSTMMANLMPSLASMDNKELLVNGTGLVILFITLIVNTLIQIETGLLSIGLLKTCIWLGAVASSVMIFISIAITTPTIKQILEFKYQAAQKVALRYKPPQNTVLNVEGLMQHVKIYWVMARTSNLQLVMASTSLCSAASVISVALAIIHLRLAVLVFVDGSHREYYSDYKWSMLAILIIQCVGIIVGNIAPLFRCFTALGFKLSLKWTLNQLAVVKVEKYWTQKWSAWKESHLAFPLGYRILKVLVHNVKNLALSLCIGLQKVIVVSCKVIELIPIFVILIMYSLYRVKSLKPMLSGMLIAKMQHDNTVHEPNQNDIDNDVGNYILQLQDETTLEKRTVKRISNSLNRLMQKAEKKQKPNKLLKLLQKSDGFKGVETFDCDHVQPLPSLELINCWSLPVVTLTCIAIALPDIREDTLDCLINSVVEGLSYTRLVEESLNISHDSVHIHELINNLWNEVDVNCRWLKTTLKGNAYKGRTLKEIVKFFHDKAKETVDEIQNKKNERALENSRHKLIAASSMYRITQALMLKNQCIIEQNSEDLLFDTLCSMIADILVACLTNLPHVIEMKCHEPVIEKREASVEAAAELLGRAKEIIENIQMRELPSLDPNQMASIVEWHNYLKAHP